MAKEQPNTKVQITEGPFSGCFGCLANKKLNRVYRDQYGNTPNHRLKGFWVVHLIDIHKDKVMETLVIERHEFKLLCAKAKIYR